VIRADRTVVAVRSLDGAGGRLRRAFRQRHGARILKAREVRYHRATAPDGAPILVKAMDGAPDRVLARGLDEIRFEYRDDAGEALSPSQVRHVMPGAVKARLVLSPAPGSHEGEIVPPLMRVVALDVHSANLPFDVPRPGFRLRRVFRRIQNAVSVTARPLAEAGIIVAAGQPRSQSLGYLYTFPFYKLVRDARVDSFVPLFGVRDTVAGAFPPEDSPLAGSLFVVTGGVRSVEVWRVSPDVGDQIGPTSERQLFASVRHMSSAGGAVFANDGLLYISDPAAGRIVRIRADGPPGAPVPEVVASMPGRPGPLALGRNGTLYVLVDERSTGLIGAGAALWEIPLESDEEPSPRRVAPLPGEARSLARDPLTGGLFALFGERGGDTILLEMTRRWLKRPEGKPREVFRLSAWKREVETTLPDAETPGIDGALFPTRLEFASFDDTGAVYFGAASVGLVLKCDLDRPGGVSHHRVRLAAVVEQDLRSETIIPRVLGWRRATPGL
jgi:hypothetical protein